MTAPDNETNPTGPDSAAGSNPAPHTTAALGRVVPTDYDELPPGAIDPSDRAAVEAWADQVVAANWDSIVFDVGEETLRRVPMMEPGRGTRSQVGTVISESATPAELLARLAGR